jgi:translocator protein
MSMASRPQPLARTSRQHRSDQKKLLNDAQADPSYTSSRSSICCSCHHGSGRCIIWRPDCAFPNLTLGMLGLLNRHSTHRLGCFGPVWTTFYALMACSLWRILRLPAYSPSRQLALSLFFLQIGLNMAWSWMFFAAHNPVLGVINIFPQLLAVVATAAVFHQLDRIAGWCLVPLAAWVAFAAVLNVEIWRLNG